MMNRFIDRAPLLVVSAGVCRRARLHSSATRRSRHRETLPIFRPPRVVAGRMPLDDAVAGHVSTIPHVRLLERDDDLAALPRRADGARAGAAAWSSSRGESGRGQEHAAAGVRRASVGDVPVLWGACDPLLDPRPLGPLHDLAAQLGDASPGRAARRRQPHEIFAAVFEHLRAHPSVLVVDDLHWADQGTIDLLRFLLRRIRITRLAGGRCAARRRDRRHAPAAFAPRRRRPLARCRRSRHCSPLSVDAIADAGRGPPGRPGWLHRLTGGNPFYVVEMLDHDDGEISAHRARRDPRPHQRPRRRRLGPAPPARLRAGSDPRSPARPSRHRAARVARASTSRGSSVADRAASPSATISAGWRSPAPSRPAASVSFHRRMLDALERRRTPTRPCWPTTRSAPATQLARFAMRPTPVVPRRARGAHTQAAAFFQTALERGAPESAADEAELLELLAERVLPDRSARRRHRRQRAGDAAARAEPGRRRRQHQPSRAVRVPVVQRQPEHRGTCTPPRPKTCSTATSRAARTSDARPPRPRPCDAGLPRHAGQRRRAGAAAARTSMPTSRPASTTRR